MSQESVFKRIRELNASSKYMMDAFLSVGLQDDQRGIQVPIYLPLHTATVEELMQESKGLKEISVRTKQNQKAAAKFAKQMRQKKLILFKSRVEERVVYPDTIHLFQKEVPLQH